MATGLAGVWLSTMYAGMLFLESSGSVWGQRIFSMIGFAYLIGLLLPLMAHFQSSILGFVLVGVFYAMIGFYIFVFPGVICIGFDGEDSMTRNILTSIVLICGVLGLRLGQTFYPDLTKPLLAFLSPA